MWNILLCENRQYFSLFIQSSLDSNNRNVRVFQILPKFGEFYLFIYLLNLSPYKKKIT